MLSEMINDDKNLLISPCRLMSLLSFLYGYSSEESKRRIEMLLGIDFKNTEQVHNSMSQSVILPTENYESWVRDDEKQLVKATICSSLWIDPSVTVSEGVNKTLREWIIEKKIFSFSSTELQKEIKDYVAKYTNGLIKNLSLSIDSCNSLRTNIISAPKDFNVAETSNVRTPERCVKLFVSTITPASMIDASSGVTLISGL
jgi:serine protease inhibitor